MAADAVVVEPVSTFEFRATAKLNDVEPFAYLRDALERLADGHPMSRVDKLLPFN